MNRLIEPGLSLSSYDPEHVLIRVASRRNAESPAVVEIVVEDAALKELYANLAALGRLVRPS